VTHLLLRRDEVLILDMEAGVEHLGRGTAGAVDAFVVVVEPGRRSIQTARSILSLAKDLGIQKVYAVGNKMATEDDEAFVTEQLPGFHLLGFLPSDLRAIEADRRGLAVYGLAPELVTRVGAIIDRLASL
jgi:CO dehydrogenase maturation factor